MALIICPECQKQISEYADACPNCGFPLHTNTAIGRRRDIAGLVEKPKRKGKRGAIIAISIILTVVLIISALCVVFMLDYYKQKELEEKQESIAQEQAMQEALAEQEHIEAREEYISDLKEYVLYVKYGCYEASLSCGLTRSVWYDSIYKNYNENTALYTQTNGKFHDDFHDSLEILMDSDVMKGYTDAIIENRETVGVLYKDLLNPPSEFENVFEQVEILYDMYYEFTALALLPTGSLNSFAEECAKYTEETASLCNKLDLLIPEK